MGNGKKMAIIYAVIVFFVFVLVDVAYLSFASNNIKRKYAEAQSSEKLEEENEKAKFDPEDTTEPTTEEGTTEENTSEIDITAEPSTTEEITSSSTEESITVSTGDTTSSTTEEEQLISVISGTTSTTTPTTVQTKTTSTPTTPGTKKTSSTTKKPGGTTKKTSSTKTASSGTRTSSSSKKTIVTIKTTKKVTTTMKPASYSSGRQGANAAWEWVIKNKVDDIRAENDSTSGDPHPMGDTVMAELLRNEAEELAYYFLNHKASELSAKVAEYSQATGYTLGFRAHKEYGINPTNGANYLASKVTADRNAKVFTDDMYHYIGVGVMHAKTSSGELLDTAVLLYRYGE